MATVPGHGGSMTTPSSTPTTAHPPVAVLGLGPMGAALARAFLAAGVETTVWNRTPSRSEALRADGARVAASATDAVAAADLVVACLRDHASTRAVLGDVPDGDFAGRTVVNLASSTPEESRSTARWAAARGLTWLNGAILAPTPLVGTAEALVLYSGDAAVLERHRPRLELLAGRSEHVGDDPGLASLLDTAMLEVFFASITAFAHAAAMTTAQGVSARDFLPRALEALSIVPGSLEGMAADIDAGTYPGDEDRVSMDLAGLRHISATSHALGLDSRLPDALRDLGVDTEARGHGDDGWSSVVEVIRKPA